jgi:hypothetical protein
MLADGPTRVVSTDLFDTHLIIRLPTLHHLIFGQRYQRSAILELLTLVAHYAIHRQTHLWLVINELTGLLVITHHATTVTLFLDLGQIHGTALL